LRFVFKELISELPFNLQELHKSGCQEVLIPAWTENCVEWERPGH
jgi:hypothetical protein